MSSSSTAAAALAALLALLLAAAAPADAAVSCYKMVADTAISGQDASQCKSGAQAVYAPTAYTTLSDCEVECNTCKTCVAFVDNYQASPKQCVLKLCSSTYTNTAKNTWVYDATIAGCSPKSAWTDKVAGTCNSTTISPSSSAAAAAPQGLVAAAAVVAGAVALVLL
eukprot:CAMPEP_0197594170 /NCGR_PEP_ID=MMETSP1326-20131121/19935_1 /TAXON_ID=1155430 /ORGANISM="Genus nov. species nov., Strain RCC2288" /LENGTH=166 /DNA_ID=CAMNT_0043160297 /DNA_START=13 /DNA_END=513 /DNA_ORIENTATION=+